MRNPGYCISLRHQLLADFVDLLAIHAGDGDTRTGPGCWLVTPVLISSTGNGRRNANTPGIEFSLPIICAGHCWIGGRSSGRFDEGERDALVRRQKTGGAGHRKVRDDIRVLMQSLVHAILQRLHLIRRRAFRAR